MTVTFEHILVPAHDREASAHFVADVLGVESLGLGSTAGPPASPECRSAPRRLTSPTRTASTSSTTPSRRSAANPPRMTIPSGNTAPALRPDAGVRKRSPQAVASDDQGERLQPVTICALTGAEAGDYVEPPALARVVGSRHVDASHRQYARRVPTAEVGAPRATSWAVALRRAPWHCVGMASWVSARLNRGSEDRWASLNSCRAASRMPRSRARWCASTPRTWDAGRQSPTRSRASAWGLGRSRSWGSRRQMRGRAAGRSRVLLGT